MLIELTETNLSFFKTATPNAYHKPGPVRSPELYTQKVRSGMMHRQYQHIRTSRTRAGFRYFRHFFWPL